MPHLEVTVWDLAILVGYVVVTRVAFGWFFARQTRGSRLAFSAMLLLTRILVDAPGSLYAGAVGPRRHAGLHGVCDSPDFTFSYPLAVPAVDFVVYDAPVVAVFVLGRFWRRANGAGALAGLLVGIPLGIVGWVAVELLGVIELQYLYAAMLMFVVGLALVAITLVVVVWWW